MVNNIKITDAIQDVDSTDQKLIILTTGEDSYVRFWNTGFKMIHEHLVKSDSMAGQRVPRNSSVQSIDVFCCSPPPTKVINGERTTGYDYVNVSADHPAHLAAGHEERLGQRADRHDQSQPPAGDPRRARPRPREACGHARGQRDLPRDHQVESGPQQHPQLPREPAAAARAREPLRVLPQPQTLLRRPPFVPAARLRRQRPGAHVLVRLAHLEEAGDAALQADLPQVLAQRLPALHRLRRRPRRALPLQPRPQVGEQRGHCARLAEEAQREAAGERHSRAQHRVLQHRSQQRRRGLQRLPGRLLLQPCERSWVLVARRPRLREGLRAGVPVQADRQTPPRAARGQPGRLLGRERPRVPRDQAVPRRPEEGRPQAQRLLHELQRERRLHHHQLPDLRPAPQPRKRRQREELRHLGPRQRQTAQRQRRLPKGATREVQLPEPRERLLPLPREVPGPRAEERAGLELHRPERHGHEALREPDARQRGQEEPQGDPQLHLLRQLARRPAPRQRHLSLRRGWRGRQRRVHPRQSLHLRARRRGHLRVGHQLGRRRVGARPHAARRRRQEARHHLPRGRVEGSLQQEQKRKARAQTLHPRSPRAGRTQQQQRLQARESPPPRESHRSEGF